MSPATLRHLLKGAELLAIFLALCGSSVCLLTYASLWFLRWEQIEARGRWSVWKVWLAFTILSRRRRLAVVAVILACLAVRAALIPIVKIPTAESHDEFSYLLAADTFSHGRLTNPTPAMWKHFESMHILMRPSYMSMYPPGQGLMLALGERLGNAWISVWILAALLCGAICWALQAWLPPRWALLGGVLAILQFGVLSYWVNAYYCTSLPAIGGALVLGALPRLRRTRQPTNAVLLGLGIALMALTRPYEGLVFCIPIAIALLLWLAGRNHPPLGVTLAHMIAPILLVVGGALVFQGYYNWRVVGNPLVMPYQVNQRTYAVVPLFLWQKMRPEPSYRNVTMHDYYTGWEVQDYRKSVGSGFIHMSAIKLYRLLVFYLAPFLVVALICLPCALRDRRLWFLWIVLAVTLAGMEVEVFIQPHYAAPVTVVFVALAVQGLRHLRLWRWQGARIGRWLAIGAVAGCFLFDAAWVSALAVRVNDYRLYQEGNRQRAKLLQQLRQMPGRQLVIVHYGPDHAVHHEWVYNRADIEHATVVWARDLGDNCNLELIRYYSERHVWLVQADDNPPELLPYPVQRLTAASAAECP